MNTQNLIGRLGLIAKRGQQLAPVQLLCRTETKPCSLCAESRFEP